MNDMSPVIVPKSDQMSADDLISGPLTIRIVDVDINPGTEQPVTIGFEGDEGRPWKPCKSMSRVLVNAWGPDAKNYIGRSVTLFRDPTVTWGGMAVGGIRISHLSNIDETMQMALTATRGKRKPFIVKPLKVEQGPDTAKEAADKIIATIGRAPDLDKLNAYIGGKPSAAIEEWDEARPELSKAVRDALQAKRVELAPADDEDPFADDTPAWQQAADDLRAQIEAANTDAALKKADEAYTKHAAAFPENVSAELDAALAAKRREVGGDA